MPDNLTVIGGQFCCNHNVHHGGHLAKVVRDLFQQRTILCHCQFAPHRSSNAVCKGAARFDTVDMSQTDENLFPQENLIVARLFQFCGSIEKLTGAFQQRRKRKAKADDLTITRADAIALAVRAVMTLDQSKVYETVDMATESPLVYASDPAAYFQVGSEHSVTLPWPEEAKEGLQGLDVPRL